MEKIGKRGEGTSAEKKRGAKGNVHIKKREKKGKSDVCRRRGGARSCREGRSGVLLPSSGRRRPWRHWRRPLKVGRLDDVVRQRGRLADAGTRVFPTGNGSALAPLWRVPGIPGSPKLFFPFFFVFGLLPVLERRFRRFPLARAVCSGGEGALKGRGKVGGYVTTTTALCDVALSIRRMPGPFPTSGARACACVCVFVLFFFPSNLPRGSLRWCSLNASLGKCFLLDWVSFGLSSADLDAPYSA